MAYVRYHTPTSVGSDAVDAAKSATSAGLFDAFAGREQGSDTQGAVVSSHQRIEAQDQTHEGHAAGVRLRQQQEPPLCCFTQVSICSHFRPVVVYPRETFPRWLLFP